jgi:hypothetical protein
MLAKVKKQNRVVALFRNKLNPATDLKILAKAFP